MLPTVLKTVSCKDANSNPIWALNLHLGPGQNQQSLHMQTTAQSHLADNMTAKALLHVAWALSWLTAAEAEASCSQSFTHSRQC